MLILFSCQSEDQKQEKYGGTPKSGSFTSQDTLNLLASLNELYQSAFFDANTLFSYDENSDVDGFIKRAILIDYLQSNATDESLENVNGLIENENFQHKTIYQPFYNAEEREMVFCFYEHSMSNDNHILLFDVDGNILSIETENITEELNIVFIANDDLGDDEIRALPWHRCYCTRGTVDEDRDGNITISSQGTCDAGRNEVHCGSCGRADFGGNCSGVGCPGC